ncbi:MAG: winged helix-turn-helix domain-containing protein [Candidatus Thorarchaeota archaeon]
MRSKKPYRSKMRILADMMRAILEEGEGGAGPTRILYGANLSHDRLKQYLDELIEKGLVRENNEGGSSRTYVLTDRGREFLREFAKIERFAQAFGIEI